MFIRVGDVKILINEIVFEEDYVSINRSSVIINRNYATIMHGLAGISRGNNVELCGNRYKLPDNYESLVVKLEKI